MMKYKNYLLSLIILTFGIQTYAEEAASTFSYLSLPTYEQEVVTVPEKEGFVNSHGVEIYFRVYGKGKPLLIINGGPGMSSEGFVPLAKELAKGRRTIIFDQRGTGKSKVEAPSNENISMQLMVADMEAIRKHLEISKWTILGHSFGGMLAAYYASDHPDNVSGLIFSSSGGLDLELFSYLDITSRLSPTETNSLQYWTERFDQGDHSYKVLLGRGRALAPAYLVDKSHVPTIAERLTQINFDINQLVFSDMQAIEFDCKKQLANFRAPTLIIQGEDDIIDKATALRTQEVISHAEVYFLEDCGHYGWLDQRAKYFKKLKKFLNTQSG